MTEESMNAFAPPKANLEGGAVEAGAQRLAERGTRLAAFLLNVVAVLPILISSGAAAAVAARDAAGGLAFDILRALAGFLSVALFVYQVVHLSTKGQSLGKRWMRIRIVKMDGSPPGFVHAVLLRLVVNALICAVPYLGTIYWLVDTLFVFRDDRRCIHDLIAGTRVIVAE